MPQPRRLVRRLECTQLEERTTPATVPTGYEIIPIVSSGIGSPTGFALIDDGRVLVTQQTGALRIVQNGTLVATPALSLTVDSSGERGLLGVAVDPSFASNNYIYVYYTVPGSPAHNRVSRFTLTGNTAGSELILLELNNLTSATNHNGGALHFGADGKLYIATGDNATGSNAQVLTNLHGKILRINKDGTIPTDNPFYNTATGNNRAIWTLGLRNPFSFAVQPGTGRIFINDVGQNTWEEINDGIAGSNYGWPGTEGETGNPSFRSPLLAYSHGNGGDQGFAITGGVFYNPTTLTFESKYTGDYFYTDLVNGWIRSYDIGSDTSAPFLTGADDPVGLGVAPDGSLMYVQRGGGGGLFKIQRIVVPVAPTISTSPASQTVGVGQSVTFSVSVSGTTPLTYRWQRNNTNIPNQTNPTLTLNNIPVSENGSTYRVIVTNSVGSDTSDPATLTVLNNQPPSAIINTPTAGTRFKGGDTIAYSGSANDPETGTLSGSAFTWKVEYITNSVVRPFVQPITGRTSGNFVIPRVTPYTATDVSFRITLTVTDPAGLITTTVREILPQLGTITLNSNIAAVLTLDGQPVTNGVPINAVVGLERPITAPASVTINGQLFSFVRWEQGGAREQVIQTPAGNTTFTSIYQFVPIVGPPVIPPVSPPGTPPVPPAISPQTPPIVVGSGPGTVGVVRIRFGDGREDRTLAPFGDFTGGVRVAQGDVTGDGVADFVIVAGPGGGPVVKVFDGVTLVEIDSFLAFEDSFRGGVFVAIAGFGAGQPSQIILSADVGGSSRIRKLSGDGTIVYADFFAIDDPDFRGGSRVTLGDVTGDGIDDLIVAAGNGGGPRIAIYDGKALNERNELVKPIGDFFVFEPTLRNGVFVAAGDLNADSIADIVFGGGPGGGPRVLALDGATLMRAANPTDAAVLANFFIGSSEDRSGVGSINVRDITKDNLPDIVATETTGIIWIAKGNGRGGSPNDGIVLDDGLAGVFVD